MKEPIYIPRWVIWPVAIFLTLQVLFDFGTAFFTKSLADQGNEQRAANALLAQQNKQTALQFRTFLHDLTGEFDYICYVSTARAAMSGLEPPPPGVCAVKAP